MLRLRMGLNQLQSGLRCTDKREVRSSSAASGESWSLSFSSLGSQLSPPYATETEGMQLGVSRMSFQVVATRFATDQAQPTQGRRSAKIRSSQIVSFPACRRPGPCAGSFKRVCGSSQRS